MSKVLLILGLTILYYAILIYWDRKKRAAFKLAQKKVIGGTTPLPIIEEEEENATELFGATNLDTIIKSNEQQPTAIKTEGLFEKLELSDNHLENDLEDLALDLAAEQTFEIPNDTLIQDLAATTKENLKEEDIIRMVAKISNRKS